MPRFQVPESPEPPELLQPPEPPEQQGLLEQPSRYLLRSQRSPSERVAKLEFQIAELQKSMRERLTGTDEQLLSQISKSVTDLKDEMATSMDGDIPTDFCSDETSTDEEGELDSSTEQEDLGGSEGEPTDNHEVISIDDNASTKEDASANADDASMESDSCTEPGSILYTDDESTERSDDVSTYCADYSYSEASATETEGSGDETCAVSTKGSFQDIARPTATKAYYDRLVDWQIERHGRWSWTFPRWRDEDEMRSNLHILSASELHSGRLYGRGNRGLIQRYCAYVTQGFNWGPPAEALMHAARPWCKTISVEAWMLLEETRELLILIEDWYFKLSPQEQRKLSKNPAEWGFRLDDQSVWKRAFDLCG